MRTLEIINVGPISKVKIALNRYNVFIGEQSSGKSTIAKLISHCLWLEKEISIHPYNSTSDYQESFKEDLTEFHSLDGYINNKSIIRYESEFLSIDYSEGQCRIRRKQSAGKYHRNKILYVPAERNIVVYSDNIGGANNLRSFSSDWKLAREGFDKDHKNGILNLGVSYYNEISGNDVVDRIEGGDGDNHYDIKVKSASSGLQSVIPIVTTIDFFTSAFFRSQNIDKMLGSKDKYNTELLVRYFIQQKLQNGSDASVGQYTEDIYNEVIPLLTTEKIAFVIEEPENNLFPRTQYDLTKFLFNCSNRNAKEHSVTITTHSPYILSTINILILAGKLQKNSKLLKQSKKIVGDFSINPGDISVWAVDHGKVKTILDKNTQMISDNYLDSVSDVLAGEFNGLYDIFIKDLRNNR